LHQAVTSTDLGGGEPILVAAGVGTRFNALVVLDGIDFSMRADEAVGIVGPNGAGKTTFLAVLSGAHTASAGRVRFAGQDVTALPAPERSRRGIVRTHQIPCPFGGMTVFENVMVAAAQAGATGGYRQAEAYDRSLDSLRLCGMLPIANRRAETLGLLDRKRLELARALGTAPKLLLLDEIGGGLTDAEAGELVGVIRELRGRGIALIWIEHIVHVLLQVAERLVCMDAGRIIADGAPDAVMADKQVVEAYLGGSVA
jgi:branched-chain amino acid transport system ATP-binding protein